jgi:hypothetical protein
MNKVPNGYFNFYSGFPCGPDNAEIDGFTLRTSKLSKGPDEKRCG